VTEHDTSTSNEEESSQLCDLANLNLKECKNAGSLIEMDTAVSLFRDVLNRRPSGHPLRSDSLKSLAAALVTRFSITYQRQDLDQAIKLLGNVESERGDGVMEIRRRSPHDVRALFSQKLGH
jgi:hypothetical protein